MLEEVEVFRCMNVHMKSFVKRQRCCSTRNYFAHISVAGLLLRYQDRGETSPIELGRTFCACFDPNFRVNFA